MVSFGFLCYNLSLFRYMLQPLGQDRVYMGIRQGIIDGFAVPAELHQLALLQYTELMGDGALGHAKGPGNIADAQLLAGQGMEDAQPGRISEYLEEICQMMQVVVADLAAEADMMFMVNAADRGLCFDFFIHCQSQYLSYCFSVFYFTRKADDLQHKIKFIPDYDFQQPA